MPWTMCWIDLMALVRSVLALSLHHAAAYTLKAHASGILGDILCVCKSYFVYILSVCKSHCNCVMSSLYARVTLCTSFLYARVTLCTPSLYARVTVTV